MSRTPNIPDTARAEFARLWDAGESVAVMADHFACSRPCISQTARRFGLTSRQKDGTWTPALGEGKRDRLALTGGAWIPDEHGIARWIPGATA